LSIKARVYGWIFLGLVVLPSSSAQAYEYGDYSEPDVPSDHSMQRPYRWRPVESNETAHGTRDNAAYPPDRAQGPPQYRDYTDTPFGLPQGVYRPVKERHNIIPHHQGYRFRPLTPNEQVRVRTRNKDQQNATRHMMDGVRPEYRSQTTDGPVTPGQGGVRFRPDVRFPSPGEDPLQNYSPNPGFSDLYPSTLFRPLRN
jgi:hypothetical protein